MPSTSHTLEVLVSSARNASLASLAAAALLLSGLTMSHDVQAKKHKGHKATASHAASGKGSKANSRPSSSEESRAERERRLLRECHGMPDAGACRGYTRG